ncbi:MAG TPA: GTPase HflX, partial [Nitrospirota bacterium]
MTLLSREINRQIGVIIDRRGEILFVIVGDTQGILIPELSDYPTAGGRLRGLRLVHTHLKDEPLTNDDLTDLALLRLDAVAALGVLPDGFPGRIYLAHLLPPNPAGHPWMLIPPMPFHQLDVDAEEFVTALEDEMTRAQSETFDIKDKREKAMLVSVMPKASKAAQEEAMEELRELAESADVIVLDIVKQRPDRINPRTLMGEGRLKDVIISAL